MKILENIKGRAAIHGTAERFGQTPEEVRREIQACIDEGWANDDPEVQRHLAEVFPNGKPTPEQFIITVAKIVK